MTSSAFIFCEIIFLGRSDSACGITVVGVIVYYYGPCNPPTRFRSLVQLSQRCTSTLECTLKYLRGLTLTIAATALCLLIPADSLRKGVRISVPLLLPWGGSRKGLLGRASRTMRYFSQGPFVYQPARQAGDPRFSRDNFCHWGNCQGTRIVPSLLTPLCFFDSSRKHPLSHR